jgi:hypothetical protein
MICSSSLMVSERTCGFGLQSAAITHGINASSGPASSLYCYWRDLQIAAELLETGGGRTGLVRDIMVEL